MELVKPVEPVLWASIVELVIGGTGYGTVEALVLATDETLLGLITPSGKEITAQKTALPRGQWVITAPVEREGLISG